MDWNFISVTLTIFEVFLVVALAGGFWMLRGAAQDAARKEATEVAGPIAESVARKAALQWARVVSTSMSGDTDSHDLDSMIDSFADGKGATE